MMQQQTITYSKTDGIVLIELNRPDVLNSLTRTLCAELLAAFAEAENDQSVRAIILTGKGRGFCAGQDLADIERLDGAAVRAIVHDCCAKLVRAIQGSRLPYVCAVNGVAAGAGANLALCCDLVVAAAHAYFLQSFVHIGLIPDTAGTYFLPRLMGLPLAKAHALLGEKLMAEEAVRCGAIYKSCPAEVLMQEANALAAVLAGRPPRAIAQIKRALHASLQHTLEEQLALEEEVQADLGDSADFQEGVQAFLEKRKPVFSGK